MPDLGASENNSQLTPVTALVGGRIQYRVVQGATGEITPPAQLEEG